MWSIPLKFVRFRLVFPAVFSLLMAGFTNTVLAHSYETTLNVASYGGTYTRSQMLAYVRPWEATSGKVINMIDYAGGLDEIKSQVQSANVKWDVVDMELSSLISACDAGLLEPTDASLITDGADGTPASEDIPATYWHECGYPSVIWSTVIAYHETAFPDVQPTSIRDFFDLEKFPGKRGLRRTPAGLLEWALIADGIAPQDVYAILSTPHGVALAFDIATRLKSNIVWWTDGNEPVEMLLSDQVSMSTAWNGRLYSPIVNDGQPLSIIWDGHMVEVEYWAIPKGSPRLENARQFIQFATQTENMAKQTQYIPYGPVRKSAQMLIDETIKPYLPTSNLDTAFQVDSQWWAQNMEHISVIFEEWLAPKPDELERQVRF